MLETTFGPLQEKPTTKSAAISSRAAATHNVLPSSQLFFLRADEQTTAIDHNMVRCVLIPIKSLALLAVRISSSEVEMQANGNWWQSRHVSQLVDGRAVGHCFALLALVERGNSLMAQVVQRAPTGEFVPIF